MAVDFVSLAFIALVAATVPILARAIPGRVVPEVVFLLIAGAIMGPHLLGLVAVDDTISFLSDLGLAFLFLLAGFEIDPKNITGTQGKHGLVTWAVSFLLAAAFVYFSGVVTLDSVEGIAVAIALTTTALGTLLPIMKERGLMGTPMGDSILAYGTWGELGPVLAMALLLSTRSTVATLGVLLGMALLCLAVVLFAGYVSKYATKVYGWITEASQTTSQTYVRFTVLLLVLLLAFAEIFHLDIVLGAFAAGFVLRYLLPEENHTLEVKLDGMAHGFFIPLFFVVSGANINLLAIGDKPFMLVGFIVLLLAIRGLPVFLSLTLAKGTKSMTRGKRMSVAAYCTTALPIIVAVTSVAVSVGAMSADTSSVLVAAGAVTVLIMPFLGMVLHKIDDDYQA